MFQLLLQAVEPRGSGGLFGIGAQFARRNELRTKQRDLAEATARCVSVRASVCLRLCAFAGVRVRACGYACACVCVRVCVCACVLVRMRVRARACVRVYVCVRACLRVCLRVCVGKSNVAKIFGLQELFFFINPLEEL